MNLNRRQFVRRAALATGALLWEPRPPLVRGAGATGGPEFGWRDLPVGDAPAPVSFPHFPDRLHAFVWRNWDLVPIGRVAQVVGARTEDILRLGEEMGLPAPRPLGADSWRRSAVTVVRRNWHLLPYDQLLKLLGWSADQMAYALREDDFLWVKLGGLKPRCGRLEFHPADAAAKARRAWMRRIIREYFPGGLGRAQEPLFDFVGRLSSPTRQGQPARGRGASGFSPRFCYSYFALYGDPLVEGGADPYPDGLLERLAGCGVDGVWLPAVLYKLARFPWQPELSAGYPERLRRLRSLVARAQRHGLRVYLYLNEPRAMPLSFFVGRRRDLRGVVDGDHAALCTSVPAVRDYLRETVASIAQAASGLGGFFTITGSENLTNCWSHGGGAGCPRCAARGPAAVIAEVNGVFEEGLEQAGSRSRLMVWDWGWAEAWVAGILERLPAKADFISVSEWGIPIRRGGVATTVGEYSISVIGPGERARRHWALARRRGLRTIAKIQAGNTWELSAVPYIPALENVARHAANLAAAGVDGLMLSWTLGGYPSPNLEVVAAVARLARARGRAGGGAAAAAGGDPAGSAAEVCRRAMQWVARRRFGRKLSGAAVKAWRQFSAAFGQFPFDAGLVYHAPIQFGPSNLLWGEPTGFRATMIGFPYDDLAGWRTVYPVEVFIGQFEKMAGGFEAAIRELQAAVERPEQALGARQTQALRQELGVAEATAIHFRTVANQARFVQARDALAACRNPEEGKPWLRALRGVLEDEIALARRLYRLQCADSRLGFEASNEYYYVPLDLVEKVLNCRDLLDHWLPSQRRLRNPRR